jgi:hypothetical protein
MIRLRMIALILAFGFAAGGAGCTTTHSNSQMRNDGYYRRGSVHSDSFPPNYVPGRHRSWGSYGRYGGYGRYGW